MKDLLRDLEKHPDLIEGAVEYAYQRGDISRDEYECWIKKINGVA